MATVYPGGIDAWQDPLDSDSLSTSPDGRDHQQHHVDLNAVALTMETQLAGPAFTSSSAYDDVAAEVVHSADATSDGVGTWNATNTKLSDTPSVDTSNKTEGTGSVTCDLQFPGGSGRTGNLYFDLATPMAVGGHGALTVDCRFHVGSGSGSQTGFRVVVTDGAGLTGTLASSDITQDGDTQDLWFTMTVPLTGLTTVASVGIEKNPSKSGSSSKWVTWWLDNINLREGTALDSALKDVDGAVVVPADATFSTEQFPDTYSTVRSVLDLRTAHATHPGINGTYNLRDWRLDETGTDDVTEDLQRIVDSLPDGSTLLAPASGVFRIDDTVTIGEGQHHITFDGQGSRWVQPNEVNAPLFSLTGTENTIRGVRGYSTNTTVTTDVSGWVVGDASHPIVGTPTASGTSVLLDAQNDQVEIPWKGDDAISYYARDYTGTNTWVFTLSDTNQVASDCQVVVMERDGTVLQTTTMTLSGTPTDYTITYVPTNLYIPLRVAVKKATATANTITLSQVVQYGRQSYDSDLAFNHLVAVSSGAASVNVIDCWAEGMAGDAVTTGSAQGLFIDNLTSRVNGRQGVSFNTGSNIIMRNSEVIAAARHSIDLEPETTQVFVSDIIIENCRFFDPGLGHFAATAWARVHRVVLRNCDFIATAARGGPFFTGGWWEGTIENCSFIRWVDTAQPDINFAGRGVSIRNCTSTSGITLSFSNTRKDEHLVTQTSDYISVHGWRALLPEGAPVTVEAGIVNYDLQNNYTLAGTYAEQYP